MAGTQKWSILQTMYSQSPNRNTLNHYQVTKETDYSTVTYCHCQHITIPLTSTTSTSSREWLGFFNGVYLWEHAYMLYKGPCTVGMLPLTMSVVDQPHTTPKAAVRAHQSSSDAGWGSHSTILTTNTTKEDHCQLSCRTLLYQLQFAVMGQVAPGFINQRTIITENQNCVCLCTDNTPCLYAMHTFRCHTIYISLSASGATQAMCLHTYLQAATHHLMSSIPCDSTPPTALRW